MSVRRWLAGSGLIVLGLGSLIAHRILVVTHPGSWGGPNIGGGALVLLAILSVLAGTTLLITGVRAAKHAEELRRRNGGQETPADAPRGIRAVALGTIAALVAGLITTMVLTWGDRTQTDINGAVGVTLNAAGEPVLVLQICHGSANTISVFGPNHGKLANVKIAQLTAATPLTASATIDVEHPPAGWTGDPASLRAESARQTLLIAGASSGLSAARSQLTQVSFTAQDLRTLTTETVQYRGQPDQRRGTLAQFHRDSCPSP